MGTVYGAWNIVLILALGGLLQGFETTSMSIFVGSQHFIEYFSNPGPLAQGIIAGSNPVGAFFGCWIAGSLSDRLGRVTTFQVASCVWVVGSIISICSVNLYMVVIGRAIKGLTVGIFSSLLPVYINDVIPDTKRGKATSAMQLCLTIGIMVMFYLSIACDLLNDERSFRLAWGIEVIPGALFIGLGFLLPESPKWLASKGRWAQAADVQNNIYTVNKVLNRNPIVGPANRDELMRSSGNLEKIEGVLDKYEEAAKKCSYTDLFRRDLRPHVLTGIIVQCLIQLSGIGVLMYYLTFICEMIGLSGKPKMFSASFQYIINVLFTLIPLSLLHKMRRKDVIVYGAVSLGACIGAIGGLMGYYGHSVDPIDGNTSIVWEVTGSPGNTCLALCYLFVAIFASTLSCAGWLYTNEIFPDRAKSKGSAVCMSVSWGMSFLLTFLAPISLEHLKWGTFVVFAVFCAAGALIIGLCCPETHGLNGNEINMLFASPLDQTLIDIEQTGKSAPSNKIDKTEERLPIVLEDDSDLREMGDGSETEKLGRGRNLEKTAQTLPPMRGDPLELEDNSRRAGSFKELQVTDSVQPSLFSKSVGFPFGSSELTGGTEKSELNQIQGTGHYYNLGSSESPFLNNYS